MHPLAPVLAKALARPEVRDWLTAEDVEALRSSGDALDPRAVVALGRLMRAGDLDPGERLAVDEWLKQPENARDSRWETVRLRVNDDLAEATRLSVGASGSDVLLLRDDVESALTVLGRAVLAGESDALAAVERELLSRAAVVDEAAMSVVQDVPAGAAPVTHPWLIRIAVLDPSSWWLDRVALLELRGRLGPVRLRQKDAAVSRPPIRLGKHLRGRVASAIAEVVGQEDDPALVGDSHGTLIARLFDGEIEVLAIGLGKADGLTAGLCICRKDGTDRGIEAVSGKRIEASRGAAGWWVPLSSVTEPGELVVRFRGPEGLREERLALEIEV